MRNLNPITVGTRWQKSPGRIKLAFATVGTFDWHVKYSQCLLIGCKTLCVLFTVSSLPSPELYFPGILFIFYQIFKSVLTSFRIISKDQKHWWRKLLTLFSKLLLMIHHLSSLSDSNGSPWGAFDSAKNHKHQRCKRQSVTAKLEKSQTPKFV